jgi:hypothetical protein
MSLHNEAARPTEARRGRGVAREPAVPRPRRALVLASAAALFVAFCFGTIGPAAGAPAAPSPQTAAVVSPGHHVGNGFFANIAFDGSNSLTVWFDNSSNSVRGALVRPDGTTLVADFAISPAGEFADNPDVTFNGTNYLVVYGSEDGNIHGQFVNPHGTLVGSELTLAVATGLDSDNSPSVTWNGHVFVVGYEVHDSQLGFKANAATVSPTGVALQSDIDVAPGDNVEFAPTAAAAGDQFFLVWHDRRTSVGDQFGAEIFGTRLTVDGRGVATVVDPAGIKVSSSATSTTLGRVSDPDIVFDGTSYFVVWGDGRPGPAGEDIRANRVSTAGTVLSATDFLIASAPDDQDEPSIAFNGSQFLVAWTDSRNRHAGRVFETFATRVSTNGGPLDGPGGFQIPGDHQSPKVAPSTNGGWGVVVGGNPADGTTDVSFHTVSPK